MIEPTGGRGPRPALVERVDETHGEEDRPPHTRCGFASALAPNRLSEHSREEEETPVDGARRRRGLGGEPESPRAAAAQLAVEFEDRMLGRVRQVGRDRGVRDARVRGAVTRRKRAQFARHRIVHGRRPTVAAARSDQGPSRKAHGSNLAATARAQGTIKALTTRCAATASSASCVCARSYSALISSVQGNCSEYLAMTWTAR